LVAGSSPARPTTCTLTRLQSRPLRIYEYRGLGFGKALPRPSAAHRCRDSKPRLRPLVAGSSPARPTTCTVTHLQPRPLRICECRGLGFANALPRPSAAHRSRDSKTLLRPWVAGVESTAAGRPASAGSSWRAISGSRMRRLVRHRLHRLASYWGIHPQ
jgi:hypothetical protein